MSTSGDKLTIPVILPPLDPIAKKHGKPFRATSFSEGLNGYVYGGVLHLERHLRLVGGTDHTAALAAPPPLV